MPLAGTPGASTTISATAGFVSGSTTLSVQPALLTISTSSLPAGTQRAVYSASLGAGGGLPSYTWSLLSGSLPSGLTLDTAGVISGTPDGYGTFSFTVQVTDSASVTATKTLNITIDGGPILIISSASNPFSSYYAEILRAEGFTSFAVSDISSVNSSLLAYYDVVVLGEMTLTTDQVTTLSDWVNGGGRLIAMKPDKQLSGLLGLTDLSSTSSNSYLLINTSSGPGVGLVDQTIQYHGTADNYSLNGASSLATLYSDAFTATASPAVTLRSVGSNGGQAAAFTFDLARSVVYTRQGNPAWAGQDRNEDTIIRSNDLFYGDASFDRQSDWVDMNKVAIPQADEQQRLLANLIIQMNLNKKPLPRFWYFPNSVKAVVIMTGDDHDNGSGGVAGRLDHYMSLSPANCSVANWECIRATSYTYPTTALTDTQAAGYVSNGFEIALHSTTTGTAGTTGCSDWTPTSLENDFADEYFAWSQRFPSLPSPVTNRVHCVPWSDYATMPVVELSHGIRLDTTYYYYPYTWVNDRPGLFTGSGMPMRFAKADGTIIDVYQAATQMTDESGQTYPDTVDALLDKATGAEGYFGVFTANIHNDVNDETELAIADDIVNSAIAHQVPVVSASQMLTWLDGRSASRFGSIALNGNILSFSITAGQGASGLTAMVPAAASGPITGISLNGHAVSYTVSTIKGIQYAVFPAASGSYQVTYGADTTKPVVTAFTVASPSLSRNIPVATFTATDNINVTGYKITTSNTPPTAGSSGWSGTAPATYTVTSDATYTLYPWAKDTAGNVSAVYGSPQTVLVDTAAPNAPIVSGATPTNNTTPTWTWVSGGGGGIGTYRYKLDSSDMSAGTTTTTNMSYTSASALTEGSHRLYVQESDAAGNWSVSGSFAIVIDITAPTAPTVTGTTPTNDSTPTWTWTTGGGGNGTYRLRRDNSDLTTGATTTTIANYTPSDVQSEGTHTLYVQERDAAGNWSTSGSFAIAIDITAPTAPLVTGITPTNSTTPTWTWAAGGGGNGTYRFKLDNIDLTTGATTTTSTSYKPGTARTEGSHTLYVQERDAVGNWSLSGSFVIVIDITAPTAPLVTGITPTNNTTPTWTWTTGGGGIGTYRFKLDNSDLTTGATTTSVENYTPGTALPEGSHTLYVQELDDVGNWSVSGSLAIVVDITAPTAPIVSGATPTNGTTPTWTWTTGGGGGSGTYRLRLDNSDLTTSATTTTIANYAPATAQTEGSHTLYVQERDAAGNWSTSGSFTIVIDITAPTAPTVTGTTPTNDTTPTWTWTPGGGGNGTYRFKLDNNDLTTGSTTTTIELYAWYCADEGSHTLYVQERDAAGNWSLSGSFAVEIDITAPTRPTVTGTTPTNNTTPTWTWTPKAAALARTGINSTTVISQRRYNNNDTSYTPTHRRRVPIPLCSGARCCGQLVSLRQLGHRDRHYGSHAPDSHGHDADEQHHADLDLGHRRRRQRHLPL